MKKEELRISPAGFSLLKEELMRAELNGYGPDSAARIACAAIGYFPKQFTETNFVVDYSLDGPVWPFMAWPKGWDKDDKSTWR